MPATVALDPHRRPYAQFDWQHEDDLYASDDKTFRSRTWAELAEAVATDGEAMLPGLPWLPGTERHAGHGLAVVRDVVLYAAETADRQAASPGPGLIHTSTPVGSFLVTVALLQPDSSAARSLFEHHRRRFEGPPPGLRHDGNDPATWPATAWSHAVLWHAHRWTLRALQTRGGRVCGCWKVHVDLARDFCRVAVQGDWGTAAVCERGTAEEVSQELLDWPERYNARANPVLDHPPHRARVLRDARRLLDDWARARR